MKKKKLRKKQPLDEEYYLHACIKQCVSSSYFISTQGDASGASSDEAIIDFLAEIIAVTPEMPQFIGGELNCSLMSSRTYRRDDNSCSLGNPLLLCMRLSRDVRRFSAYLPSDVFWALSSDLKSGRLKHIEVSFDKPRHGSGKLKRLYFSERPPQGE